MKIALINENSQAAKNALIEATLRKVVEPMGHEVVNYGMYAADDAAQLTYVQNGILAAVLLNSGAADYVITGCGTGEGAMLALNSFPGVICGHVEDPVDAYTFAHVNDGNAVDEYQTQYLTLEKVVKILREKAATVSVQPVGVRLIVGGRNRKGVFTMTMMGSVDGYEPQTQAARKGAYLIEGACSHTDVAPWLEEEVKPQAANWHSLDDVARTLDGCIAKMAKLDKSINTTYFRQLVM